MRRNHKFRGVTAAGAGNLAAGRNALDFSSHGLVGGAKSIRPPSEPSTQHGSASTSALAELLTLTEEGIAFAEGKKPHFLIQRGQDRVRQFVLLFKRRV